MSTATLLGNLVGGSWVTDGGEGTVEVRNPADVDQIVGLVPAMSAAEVAAVYATGQVAVNLPTSGWDVHHPFGGFGDSGSAFKEQGLEGLRFYSRVKTVAVRAGS